MPNHAPHARVARASPDSPSAVDDSARRACCRDILTAYAVGDAMGMPTEFMTRQEIRDRFGLIDRLLEPEESKNHPAIPKGSVTDDTEQVLALLDEYAARGRVDADDTARRLLQWMRESGAVEKRYIGPSSKAALEAIESGTPVERAGLGGTTCGGVMRSPAATLFAEARGHDLASCVRACLVPTHFSALALGPAMGYAFALREAMHGGELEAIISAAAAGESEGLRLAPYPQCGPSAAARASLFAAQMSTGFDATRTEGSSGPSSHSLLSGWIDDALDFIYENFGTTLASADVASAALCVFTAAKGDTWLAIKMGASIGGDTDTIAALAAALSAAYSHSSGALFTIPTAIIEEVYRRNQLNIDDVIERIFSHP